MWSFDRFLFLVLCSCFPHMLTFPLVFVSSCFVFFLLLFFFNCTVSLCVCVCVSPKVLGEYGHLSESNKQLEIIERLSASMEDVQAHNTSLIPWGLSALSKILARGSKKEIPKCVERIMKHLSSTTDPEVVQRLRELTVLMSLKDGTLQLFHGTGRANPSQAIRQVEEHAKRSLEEGGRPYFRPEKPNKTAPSQVVAQKPLKYERYLSPKRRSPHRTLSPHNVQEELDLTNIRGPWSPEGLFSPPEKKTEAAPIPKPVPRFSPGDFNLDPV